MRELAARTGGSVVEPSQQSPLRLPVPAYRGVALGSWAAALGATLLAAALVWWRAR
jgi:hypothetical protein